MDMELLRELLGLMKEHELSEMEVEQDDVKIRLKKGGLDDRVEALVANGLAQLPENAVTPGEMRSQPIPPGGGRELVEVLSPMVGTFYNAPSPDAETYVMIGDLVEEETVVCIIEAMKVMNENKAETSGRVVEILSENGNSVEFAQPLFRIDPNG